MRDTWELKFESLFELSAPSYDDRQVGFLLTDAQLRIFKRHYNPFGNKYQEGFEQNEQRRRDLDQFIKSASISDGNISSSSAQTGVHPNGVFYDMPSNFYLMIEENAILSGSAVEIDVKPVKHDYYRANINHSYKKPYSNLVWRMDFSRDGSGYDGGDSFTGRTSKRVELITDGTAITDYRVRYLKRPNDIIVDRTTPANQRHCELDDNLHAEIVDEAVKIANAAINGEDYNISSAEVQQAE